VFIIWVWVFLVRRPVPPVHLLLFVLVAAVAVDVKPDTVRLAPARQTPHKLPNLIL
jgi:hypothetical protein